MLAGEVLPQINELKVSHAFHTPAVMDAVMASTTLVELLSELRATLSLPKDAQDAMDSWMTDLPTFGGDGPAGGTDCVWSWDADNLLVGRDILEFSIVSRAEYLNP